MRHFIYTLALTVASIAGYSSDPEDCQTLSNYLEIQFKGTPEAMYDRTSLDASVGSPNKRRFRTSFADTIVSYIPVTWSLSTDDEIQEFEVYTSPSLGIVVHISSKSNPCVSSLLEELRSRAVEPIRGTEISYRETENGGAKPIVVSEVELYEIGQQCIEVYQKESETQIFIFSKSRYNAVFGEERNRMYHEYDEVEDLNELYNFNSVESYPRFPGCDQRIEDEKYYCFEYNVRKVIGANFDFPDAARREGRGGVVYINFIIEYDGSISEIIVRRSSGHPDIDQAAVDAARHLPKMTPAKVNGQPVRMSYIVPINARVSDDDED